MKDYNFIKETVKGKLSAHRFMHTLNVEREAVKLARNYCQNEGKCRIAALIHDLAKELSDIELIIESKRLGIYIDDIQRVNPQLLHGPVAALYGKELFEIEDEELLKAVEYHTTGRTEMSFVEKIVYLADLIEEGRKYPGVEDLRKLAYVNINEALLKSCNSTLEYVIERNHLIHPLTVEFRNDLLLKGGI